MEKKIGENPPRQGLDKSKAKKPKGREKYEKRHNRAIENKERVLELAKQKYIQAQIAKELQMDPGNVKFYVDKLVEEGKLSRDEIEQGNSHANTDTTDKNAPEYLEQRQQIVQCLGKGWKYYYIRKVLNINEYDFNIYIKDIKYKKIMTGEEIKKAREKKRQEDLKFIEKSINDDELSLIKIHELKPEITYNEITVMAKELIDAGVVTRDKVEENKYNSMNRTKNKAVKLSLEEQVEFILDKVEKGYLPSEIVESDKTKSLTMNKVLYQKRKLITEGIIPKEQADKAMKERQDRILARKREKIINKIKEYTQLGYALVEISEFISEYNYESLCRIKSDYIKENGWYTKEELKKFVDLRKQREEEKRIEEERIAEAKKLEEEKRKREEQEELRKQKRLEKEKNERNKKIKSYMQAYKIHKREAKKEDGLEIDGKINVPIEGRKKFIEILVILSDLEYDIPDKDIEIVLNTFYVHPEIANKDSIKFLISDANRKGGVKVAEKMVLELIDALRDTKFYEALAEYRRWLKKLKFLPQIQTMKKEGMNNSEISAKLGISSAEVSILLKKGENQILQGIGIDD